MKVILTAKYQQMGGTFTLFGERLFGNIATSIVHDYQELAIKRIEN